MPLADKAVVATRKLPIIIYTDGACSGNPGPGGWAYAIDYGAKVVQKSEFVPETTTNNRMELLAVIYALKALPFTDREIIVRTDSRYVERGMNRHLAGWKKRGWKTYGGRRPVKNQDLWKTLDEVQGFFVVTWEWVPGHGVQQDFWMGKVDSLARNAVIDQKGKF